MPEFQAVQCFQCKQYQVIQKRKDGKFNCKICGSKQSVRKVIARSNKAADVRKLVQQLNLTRGQMEEQYDAQSAYQDIPNEKNSEDVQDLQPGAPENDEDGHAGLSKWAAYDAVVQRRELQSDDDSVAYLPHGTDNAEEEDDGKPEFVTALPDNSVRKQRRQRGVKATSASGSSKRVDTRGWHEQTLMSENADTNTTFEGQDKRPMKRSRGNLVNLTSTAPQRDAGWERLHRGPWDSFTLQNRQELGNDDLDRGVLTSFDDDEVVHDETIA